MIITGEDYTKWLWGNQHTDGSVYNFTTVPGEGYGDNGQGTEIDLLISSHPSKNIEVTGRLQSRFNQNQWTNYAGFGGRNPALENPPSGDCLGGDCGEFDPRSNEYIKMRGLTARFTPGFKWLDAATIGSSDLGMFDPFTIGKIRYIDRDNAKAILFQGPLGTRKLTYDLIRVSLPRLFAGPNFNTGDYAGQDGAYGLQLKFNASSFFDATGVYERVRDVEVSANDTGNNGVGQRPQPRLPLQERRLRRQVRHPSELEVRLPRPLLLLDGRVQPEVRHAHRLRPLGLLAGAGRQGQRPALQGQRRPQRSVRHRPLLQPRVFQHRRPVQLDPGGPPRGRRAADRGA